MIYRSLITNRNYLLLQIANLINRLGDSIDAIALSWLVYEVSDSAAVAAINYCLNYLPTVFLQPLMGAFVAGKPKKIIMVIADSARALIITCLALLVVSGQIETPAIILATFLMSCFETLRLPCASAIVPLLINKEEYRAASSFSASLSRISELAGQGIGGLVVASLGMHVAIFTDALSFVISALCLGFIRINESFDNQNHKTSILTNFSEGLSYMRLRPILMYICLIACLANMLLVPFNSLQSAFIATYYQADATYLSYMGVSFSLGALLGAIAFPYTNKFLSNKALILIIFPTCSLFYLGLLGAGLITNETWRIFAIIISNFITGVLCAMANALISVIIMLKTKQDYLSRVSALLSALSQALVPFISFLISLLANFLNCSIIFLISAIIITIISLGFFLSPRSEVLNA